MGHDPGKAARLKPRGSRVEVHAAHGVAGRTRGGDHLEHLFRANAAKLVALEQPDREHRRARRRRDPLGIVFERGQDPPVRFTALAVEEGQLLQSLGEDRLLVLVPERVLVELHELVNVHRAQPAAHSQSCPTPSAVARRAPHREGTRIQPEPASDCSPQIVGLDAGVALPPEHDPMAAIRCGYRAVSARDGLDLVQVLAHPEDFAIRLVRPVIRKKPSASMQPRSPVRSSPPCVSPHASSSRRPA